MQSVQQLDQYARDILTGGIPLRNARRDTTRVAKSATWQHLDSLTNNETPMYMTQLWHVVRVYYRLHCVVLASEHVNPHPYGASKGGERSLSEARSRTRVEAGTRSNLRARPKSRGEKTCGARCVSPFGGRIAHKTYEREKQNVFRLFSKKTPT